MLRGRLPTQALWLILGADAYRNLPSWHRWTELLHLAHLAVAVRPGVALDVEALASPLQALHRARHCTPEAIAGTCGGIVTLSIAPLDISSTRIRDLLAARRSPRYLLPESVLHYIEAHQLYR